MNAREKAIALRRATLQTLAALASQGRVFYDAIGAFEAGRVDASETDLATHVADWHLSDGRKLAPYVARTYAEACERGAFAIEADDASGRFRGFRLVRLGSGPSKTGQAYSGETIARTADDLWSVMRTIEDLATHPACAVQASPPPAPEAAPEAAPAPRALHVSGIRWFDSANGNTYHRAIAILDGRTIADVPFAYGYGDHFLETAAEAIEAAGILTRKRFGSGARESLRSACERFGIAFSSDVRDVPRRKDLGRPAVTRGARKVQA